MGMWLSRVRLRVPPKYWWLVLDHLENAVSLWTTGVEVLFQSVSSRTYP